MITRRCRIMRFAQARSTPRATRYTSVQFQFRIKVSCSCAVKLRCILRVYRACSPFNPSSVERVIFLAHAVGVLVVSPHSNFDRWFAWRVVVHVLRIPYVCV